MAKPRKRANGKWEIRWRDPQGRRRSKTYSSYSTANRALQQREVERSHRTDEEEFYQLLTYKGDKDLMKKLKHWEDFYNLHRPHYAHGGKTPFEILKQKLG